MCVVQAKRPLFFHQWPEEEGGKEGSVEEDALPETSTPQTASGTSPAAEEDTFFCQLCGGWLPQGPSLPRKVGMSLEECV